MYFTQELVDRIKDDSQWSNGDTLKELAAQYWQARWEEPPNDERACEVLVEMDNIKPERAVLRDDEDEVVYRVFVMTDGAVLSRLGPEWRELNEYDGYACAWTNGRETLSFCEGDIMLEVRK